MTLPLRIAAVAAGLLVSGFTAEHLASLGASDSIPPPVSTVALPAMAADSARSLPEAEPLPAATLGTGLPMGPVQGPVSSPFGWREHPVSGRVRHHDGVDLAVPAGTAVWTVAPGTVRAVGRQRGYGLVVEIEHPTGLGQPVRTRYAHLASVDASLQAGVRIGRGVAIGASGGIPGRDGVSTGAHLHFEIRDASGLPLDPASVVRLPASAHGAPRWASSRPLPGATHTPRPLPLTPQAPEALDVPPEADSLASTGDLLDLVLPDYPTLPALQGIPQP
jgi:murein DD-endopeptidase MepM/ murein hydrolase activator NlpD